jgi:CheY-specific phosphatase CheX
MAVRFFGQFLLESGVITSQQLLTAIAYQDKANLKFGDTAVQLGLLDKARLERIFALQRKEDVKTGEAGIRLGFLTEAQVDQVLRAQKNSHVMIGGALVKTGALTEAQLSEQLEAFKKDQTAYQICSGLPRQKDSTGLAAPAVDLALKLLVRLANLQVKLLDVRYAVPQAAGGTTYTARVPFAGSHRGEIALRASARVCAQIASAMLGEPVPPDAKALILDAACEFLNIVGGNLAGVGARQGKKVELSSPQTGDVQTAGRDVVHARIGTPDGDIEFIVITVPG